MYLVLHATRSLHEFEYRNMPDLDGNLILNCSPSLERRRKRAECGSTKYRFLWRGLQPFRYLPYDINALSLSLLSFRVISPTAVSSKVIFSPAVGPSSAVRRCICSNNARFVFRLSASLPLSISRKQQLAHLTHHEYRTIHRRRGFLLLATVTSFSSVKNFSVCVLIRGRPGIVPSVVFCPPQRMLLCKFDIP